MFDKQCALITRLGPDPHENGSQSPSTPGCPDIWETASGDFAVIGIDMTAQISRNLPKSASCGTEEGIVVIPRRTLVAAKKDIPDE